jgi:hypothetical protein
MLALGEAPGGNLVLSWSSVPGKRYRIMISLDLVNWSAWSDAGGEILVDASPDTSTSQLIPRPGLERGFARIEVAE